MNADGHRLFSYREAKENFFEDFTTHQKYQILLLLLYNESLFSGVYNYTSTNNILCREMTLRKLLIKPLTAPLQFKIKKI